MKKIFGFILLALVMVFVASCGRNPKAFAGTFTDEFGNKYVLNEDSTATILFAGFDSVEQTRWKSVEVTKDSVFACIEYNGDPEYYYLYKNKLYRYKADMDEGRRAIEITYEE